MARVQNAVRSACDSYCYLEIGSHLGGSIQPHLLDSKCASIISIDKRTEEQVDDYGTVTRYEGNSTERMMAELQEIDPNASGRIVCFDSNASEVEAESLPCTPDLCLIDGLHTTPAVLSDFAFCFEVCSPNAVIAFHDDLTITTALWQIVGRLERQAVVFEALKMQGGTFAIALGSSVLANAPICRQLSVDGRRWLRTKRIASAIRRVVPGWVFSLLKRLYRWVLPAHQAEQ